MWPWLSRSSWRLEPLWSGWSASQLWPVNLSVLLVTVVAISLSIPPPSSQKYSPPQSRKSPYPPSPAPPSTPTTHASPPSSAAIPRDSPNPVTWSTHYLFCYVIICCSVNLRSTVATCRPWLLCHLWSVMTIVTPFGTSLLTATLSCPLGLGSPWIETPTGQGLRCIGYGVIVKNGSLLTDCALFSCSCLVKGSLGSFSIRISLCPISTRIRTFWSL